MEPILSEENRRYTFFPIRYNTVYENYEKQLKCFWKPQEIDFSKDYSDFQSLSSNEQHFLKMILAFFASADGIVNFNISERFLKDVKIMEAQVAYNFQMMMENIHNHTYSLMLDNLIKDSSEKEKLFNSIETIPTIKKLSDWAFKWIKSEKSFTHRVVAFAFIEGVIFSGAFASIFWLKKYRSQGTLFLSGLIKSNEFIARDEGLHTEFATIIYSLLNNKLKNEEIYEIFKEGVEITKEFSNDSLPVRLLGINENSMCDYIEYVADRLLSMLNYPKIYNKTNPFPFMESIGMIQKTNFFESRPTEYQASSVNVSDIVISDDF